MFVNKVRIRSFLGVFVKVFLRSVWGVAFRSVCVCVPTVFCSGLGFFTRRRGIAI